MYLPKLVISFSVFTISVYGDEPVVPGSAPSATTGGSLQQLDQARILASKFLLSNYAVESKEFVIDYRLYNVGDKAALKVVLDDRHNFPTTHFEIIKGQLQVRWDRLGPGANVTHSVVLKPRYSGSMNYTSAYISYLPTEDADGPRIGYSTAPGEGYIYRLKDYERKFSPHFADWGIFTLMALPCLGLPFLLWYRSKSKYEHKEEKKSR